MMWPEKGNMTDVARRGLIQLMWPEKGYISDVARIG